MSQFGTVELCDQLQWWDRCLEQVVHAQACLNLLSHIRRYGRSFLGSRLAHMCRYALADVMSLGHPLTVMIVA